MRLIYNHPSSWFALCIVLLLSSHGVAETRPVERDQIKTTLVSDKATVMLGEPVYVSFVVHNHSAQDLQVVIGGDYRNSLGRPESFTISVKGNDGKAVKQPDAGMTLGGIFTARKIPANGKYTFRLFLPHWATFKEAGTYSIVAKRTVMLSPYTPDRWDDGEKTTDLKVQATAKIEIVPQDEKKMGKLVARLGDTMLGKQDDAAESATYMLLHIQDDRVIPYFIRALETRLYGKKITALKALRKFSNEAAFQAIKAAMETKAEDIGNATTHKVATQLAQNIRHSASLALSKSPHPGAIPFLLTRRHDSSEGIRITILHVLGKMKPERAIPLLQEMSNDKNKRVSDEAKRYLKLFSSRKST